MRNVFGGREVWTFRVPEVLLLVLAEDFAGVRDEVCYVCEFIAVFFLFGESV
jgi:hypothetical protein